MPVLTHSEFKNYLAELANIMYTNNPMDNVFKNLDYKTMIKTMVEGTSNPQYGENHSRLMTTIGTLDRGLGALTTLIPDKETRTQFRNYLQALYTSYIGPVKDAILETIDPLEINGAEKLKNIFLIEKDDINLLDILDSEHVVLNTKTLRPKEHFNIRNYIASGKTTSTAIVSRLYDGLFVLNHNKFFDEETRVLGQGLGLAIQEAKRINLPMSKSTAVILEAIQNNDLDSIQREDMINFSVEKHIDDLSKKPITQESLRTVKTIIREVASIKRNHDDHFFLVRWFSPTVKRQQDAYDNAKQLLVKAGIPKNILTQALDAAKNGNAEALDNAINTLVPAQNQAQAANQAELPQREQINIEDVHPVRDNQLVNNPVNEPQVVNNHENELGK